MTSASTRSLPAYSPAHTCDIEIPEILLDMDCPGHYMRQIKAVSLSIPEVNFRDERFLPFENAGDNLSTLLETVEREKLHRLFSLQHDFPAEWHQFATDGAAGNFKAVIKKEHFSFLSQGKEFSEIKVKLWRVHSDDEPAELENILISSLTDLKNELNDAGLNPQSEIELDRAILDGGGHVFMIFEYGFE